MRAAPGTAPQGSPAPLPVRAARTRPGPATRQTSLLIGPVTTAPMTARGVVRASLATWGLGHLTEDAEAITSELVTNAYTASTEKAPPGTEPQPLTLWMTAEQGALRIRVWDPDPTPPPESPADPGLLAELLAEHGRGLVIVQSLSDQWGWHPAPNGGKYVWALLVTVTG